jgi:hypothetical protein
VASCTILYVASCLLLSAIFCPAIVMLQRSVDPPAYLHSTPSLIHSCSPVPCMNGQPSNASLIGRIVRSSAMFPYHLPVDCGLMLDLFVASAPLYRGWAFRRIPIKFSSYELQCAADSHHGRLITRCKGVRRDDLNTVRARTICMQGCRCRFPEHGINDTTEKFMAR